MKFISFLAGLSVFFIIMSIWGHMTRSVISEKLEKAQDNRTFKEKLRDLIRNTGQVFATLPLFRDVVNTDKIDIKLRLVGWRISGKEFLGIWIFTLIGSIFLAILASRIFPFYLTPLIILFGFSAPWGVLDSRTNEKKLRFERDFITFTEKILVGCSGGIDFYTILLRTSTGMGFLADEVKRLVEDIRTNSTGKDAALDRFAIRLQNANVNNFITIVKHNEVNGVGFEKELSQFINGLRRTRESKIEGIARKMESKLLIPIVCTILPATFVLVIIPFLVIVLQGLK